jgi:hypothetical protein
MSAGELCKLPRTSLNREISVEGHRTRSKCGQTVFNPGKKFCSSLSSGGVPTQPLTTKFKISYYSLKLPQ